MPHAAPVEPLRRWDPERIGGYSIIGRLGSGSMGQVYLGRSAAGRLVAVKTIKPEYAEEPDYRNRFAHEVAAARRVSGAFTAPVVAADPEADMPWLATAYVPAPSLSTLVKSCGPLSVPAVRWLAAGCAEALESIHGTGLVHRDLKPSNVLVSPDGPRVIDFGVARAAERVQLTLTRGTVGTPAYMAPEQARDTRQAAPASDIYSLGATMVLAATGHAPYPGETVMDVLVQLATAPPDLSDVPAELAGIITACMQRDPRLRPSSAALLAHLAADLSPQTDSPELGHPELGMRLLSVAALALIAEYRREPRPAAQPGRPEPADGDDTVGSQPGAVAAPQPAMTGQLPVPRVRSAPPVPRGRARGAHGSGRRRPGSHRGLIAFGAAVSAIALVAGGTGLGALLAGGPGRRVPGPRASTVPSGTRGGQTSPATLPGQPPRPAAILNQTFGDGYTGFTVHGFGWPPGTRVTITLVGHGTSSLHPVVDRAGTFNYTINEAHEFFHGPMRPGNYRVRVTGVGGLHATMAFTVGGPGLPPPGPPPAQPVAATS